MSKQESRPTISSDENDDEEEEEVEYIYETPNNTTGTTSSSSDSPNGNGFEQQQQQTQQQKTKKHSKKKKKSSSKKRKHKREQPAGYHGSEIDMDAMKEQFRQRYKPTEKSTSFDLDIIEDSSSAKLRLYLDRSRKRGGSRSSRRIFLDDDPAEMTWGRRLALRLMKKKWYNPMYDDDDDDVDNYDDSDDEASDANAHLTMYEKPSLARAWAYFEHVSLQRYFVYDSDDDFPQNAGCCRRFYAGFVKADHQLMRAEPGVTARKTRLYDPISTPHSQLGAFGQGVALYFTTLRAIGLLTFLAGIVSVYSLYYFASDNYVTDGSGSDLPWLQQGSAICTDTSWVPCPDCDCSPENNSEKFEAQREWESDRCVRLPRNNTNLTDAGNFGDDDYLTFALKNNCDGAVWPVAICNYIALFVIFIGLIFVGIYVEHERVVFDEGEQTAQDYSISIKNPPPDAGDPDEWHEFFKTQCDGAQVAVCTCALDNDLLVRALVERRETYRKIRHSLPPGHKMNVLSIAHVAAETERQRTIFQRIMSGVNPGIPEYFSHLVVMNAKIQALAQLTYRTTRVFVTFETEKDQRHVLEKLSVGSSTAAKNDPSVLSHKKYLFRGKYVLDVAEAKEPNTIQWQSLNVRFIQKLRQRVFSTVCTGICIFVVTLAIRKINYVSTAGTALTISAFNRIFPYVARAIVSVEQHSNEGSLQKSLYFKIAAFRWINTVVVISLITPFTSFLQAGSGGLIPQIYAVFFSEIVTLSVLQLCDFGGHFKRHFLAPRAKNQDAMNLYFEGEDLDIAERYTNMTKIVFLALWYSAIYPGSFFLCSLAMFINYFIDRFSFMRTWKRSARLGAEISIFSRRYFFAFANCVMAVMSSFYWSAFPYDNLCDTGEVVGLVDRSYMGNFTISPPRQVALIKRLLGNEDEVDLDNIFNVTIDITQPVYTYCKQDLLSPGFGLTFPYLPAEQEGRGGYWMTPTQEQITTIFGWSSLGVVLAVLTRMAHSGLKGLYGRYYGRYVPIGDDQNIKFSDVPHISSYVPEVRSKLFSYPLLVCDSDTFNEKLIEWEDPGRPYAFYDLTKDADALMEGANYSKTQCFSQVKNWEY